MAQLTPVEFDPFAETPETGSRRTLTPVDANPFGDEPPGLASNALRNVGERGGTLLGNLVQFAGTAAERGEESLTNLFDGFQPGVMWGGQEELRSRGYEPDISVGDFGVDFTARAQPEDTSIGLFEAGQAIEDVDFGYQPNFTIDRALDDPSLTTISGAIAEQGPAALADLGALLVSTPAYLASRTEEIGESRAVNQGGQPGDMPRGEDITTAAPFAAASVALDRLAAGRLLPGSGAPIRTGRQAAGETARAVGREATTEAIQEGGIEYAGETAGTEAGYDPRQAVRRALGGALIGGPVGGAVRGTTSIVELRQNVRQELEADGVDTEGFSDQDIDEMIAYTESTSQGTVMDPEQVQDTIRTRTGQDAIPRLGEGMPRGEARRARRDRERELGDLFTQTDVLRRDDVEVTDGDVQLREGAQPLRDPTGEQAAPETYGARSAVQRTAQDMGLTLGDRELQLAARDIMADPEADVRQIVRDYSQENRQQAARIAERRRQRREEDLRREGDPERDFRAGTTAEAELTPRMRQELEAESRRVPPGVNTGQPGGPRASVDRISTTQPYGVRGDFIPGSPQGPGPAPSGPGGVDVEGEVTPGQTGQNQGQIGQQPSIEQQRQIEGPTEAAPVDANAEQDIEAGPVEQATTEDVAPVTREVAPGVQMTTSSEAGQVNVDLTNEQGTRVGRFTAEESPNQGQLRMLRQDIDTGTRGQGLGVQALADMARVARDRGLTLASDRSVSPEAARVYQALERRGATVRTNPHTVSETTGNLVSDDVRTPVFEVTDVPADLGDRAGQPPTGGVEESVDTGAQTTADVEPEDTADTETQAEPQAAQGPTQTAEEVTAPDPNATTEPTSVPGGTQLYAGIPLDRIVAGLRNVVKGEYQAFRDMSEKMGTLLEDAQQSAGGARASSRASQRSIATDLWRVTLGSLDGDMRVMANGFNSPTMKSIPDMFHATAGRADSVGQTFDEAVQARNQRLGEIDKILADMREANVNGKAQQTQIVRLLENPRTPRRGAIGKAADRIEAFLADELKYLRDAGVEVGEVTGGYFPREMDTGKASADPEGFIKAATRAYKKMGRGDEDARMSAKAYWESTVYGASGRPGFKPPSGQTPNFIQGRAFTKAAADELSAFRVTDIDAVLGSYTMRATKRAEIARRFGDNWADWEGVEQKILEEDPRAQAMLPALRDRVALSAGVNLHSLSHTAQATLSGFRTWTTLATLPKAAMASIGELVMAPVRGTTGNVPGDLAQSLTNLWRHTENFTRTMTGLGRNEKLTAAFEMAEDIGLIAGTGHNALMAARFAGGDPVGRVQSEVLASFFRRNQLEHLTNYTRVTSMQHGQVFMRRLAKQMDKNQKRSSALLRELGVPQGQETEFATWLQSFEDNLPMPSELSGEFAGVYRNALQRFADQTVMRPSASTRPKWASHPLGAMIFQLQAFGYAFQKNVINRQVRMTKELGWVDGAAFSLSALTSIAGLIAVQGMMRYWRDELYAPDINDRKTTGAFVEGAISQAGFYGVADPYLQSLTGVRYQKPLWSAFTGPFLGGIGDALDDAARAGVNNSEQTNTAERNLADSVYDWLLEPTMQAALTAAPGGPITGKLSSAATVYFVPAGREPFTDAVAGEENRTRKKSDIPGTIEWLIGAAEDDGDDTRGRDSRGSRGRDSGGRGERGTR